MRKIIKECGHFCVEGIMCKAVVTEGDQSVRDGACEGCIAQTMQISKPDSCSIVIGAACAAGLPDCCDSVGRNNIVYTEVDPLYQDLLRVKEMTDENKEA